MASNAVEVELEGIWENSKHGLQLSVSMCKEIVPTNQAGILAYLSSGVIKGVGPEIAKAIVARFGDKTMEVLDKEPQKLLSIKGIAQRKLKAIIASYEETMALSDLMIYLAPFGVSMKKAAMIKEEFGDNSLKIVKSDPFQLCKIKGFGFMTVDSIARKTKVSLKHPMRYSGAINYVLDEARVSGHLFLTVDETVGQCYDLLNSDCEEEVVSEEEIRQAITNERVESRVYVEGSRVYLSYERMLNDIKAGRINCVVVKDLSRFGREYINSGKYIHRLFPVLGVRLIAINDNIDTITRDESSEFSITLKNLMNDNYSRDISVKVRSQLQVKRKHGDFICPFAPYGYQKCEGNHNRIEPDPYAATVVQDIFNWKIQGMTNNGIAIRLAESGILAPLEYKRHKGEPLFSGFKMKERCEWTAQAVARILTNPIYIGTLRQGLRRRPNYKIKKSIPTEENEWVVIHDAHEPVVTKRTFYLAQKALLIDTRAAPRATTVYPLSGLLECGECGNAVTRSTINNGYKLYSYFRCSVRTKEDRCELKQVPEAQVEAAVLQLLQEHISAVVELDRCLSEIQQVPYQKINVAKCEQRREKLAAEIARYRDLKASLYEDMKEGLISKTDFCDIRGQYDARIADALIAQEQIDRELSIYLSGEQSPNNWMKTFTEHRGLKSLTRAVVLECIEKVVIHKDEKLEIIFEHSEDYARLVSSLQEYAARGILGEAM